MSTGMGTTAGDEVAPGALQPTHIDVHIHQEPLFLQGPSAPNIPTPSQALSSKRVLVASWVAQIVLGLLSGTLGSLGCFLFYDRWSMLFTFQTGIWTGVVALLAGVVVFIHDKRGGTCWALLRTLLALAAFATAIAAIRIVADRFDFPYFWCDGPYGSDSTLTPSTPEEARRKELCWSYNYMCRTLSMGLQGILMSIWALLLLVSLVPMLLFCWRRFRCKAEKDQKALLRASETQPRLS